MIGALEALAIWDNIPLERQELVQLQSRVKDGTGVGGGNYAANVQWRARRKKVSLELQGLLGGIGDMAKRVIEFQLFQLDGQAVTPQNLDQILDANGVTWQVKMIPDEFFALIWGCQCVQNQS